MSANDERIAIAVEWSKYVPILDVVELQAEHVIYEENRQRLEGGWVRLRHLPSFAMTSAVPIALLKRTERSFVESRAIREKAGRPRFVFAGIEATQILRILLRGS